MKAISNRLKRRQRGFTLVELLIVVAILGVLAAVVIPNVTGLVGSGQSEAAATELQNVQTAMDIMMIKTKITSVTATAATNAMGSFPTGNVLYPNYIRQATTHGTYSCNAAGLVTQATYP
jgi:type IV pilus assembly protein PilA